jgi:hypothetical protein
MTHKEVALCHRLMASAWPEPPFATLAGARDGRRPLRALLSRRDRLICNTVLGWLRRSVKATERYREFWCHEVNIVRNRMSVQL